jgi:hypothetical protein
VRRRFGLEGEGEMRSTLLLGAERYGQMSGLGLVRARGAVGVAVLIAGIVSCPFAQAQVAEAQAKDESAATAQAKRLYAEGIREAERSAWEKARGLLLKAFLLKRHPQIAFNLGQAELKVGQHPEAAEHLSFFLREAQEAMDEDRQMARKMLKEARQHVGSLVIGVAEAGALIWVDGVSVGQAPLGREVFVAPGRRVIEARLEGHQPGREERTVAAGDSLQVVLYMDRDSTEGAGEAKEGKPKNTVIVVGGAAAGALAATGVGFLVATKMKEAERGEPRESCAVQTECDRYNAAEVARAQFAKASLGSLIAAGVIGAGTLAYALIASRAKHGPRVAATALAGPGGGGGWVTVRW